VTPFGAGVVISAIVFGAGGLSSLPSPTSTVGNDEITATNGVVGQVAPADVVAFRAAILSSTASSTAVAATDLAAQVNVGAGESTCASGCAGRPGEASRSDGNFFVLLSKLNLRRDLLRT
jgi:hypothetical protein